MDEQERPASRISKRSPEEVQHNGDGYSQDHKGKLYLPKSFLSAINKQLFQLLKAYFLRESIKEKTAWDWLKLLLIPFLTAMVTIVIASKQNEISRQQNKIFQKQNEIFKQRDEAEKDRNQQALLIQYLDEITRLVEKGLLTSSDDDNSKTQRTIARARTLTLLRALDSDRKGELIEFLNAAQLIKRDQSIIDLSESYLVSANLGGAVLSEADLSVAILIEANLSGAILRRANLSGASLRGASLSGASLRGADLSGAILIEANLRGANLIEANLRGASLRGVSLKGAYLSGADLSGATELNPNTVVSACNWQQATYSKAFKEKLAQEPAQKVNCSKWE